MFTDLIARHSLVKAAKHQESEAASGRAVKAAESLSAHLVEVVNSGASEAFAQQQRIGAEVHKVLELTKQLDEQNSEWTALINSADQSLKVLGDFETYFEVLQRDLGKLTSSLHHLGQQKSEASAAAPAHP
ncbi:biogenesis of lysosome- organelles complex 1 subunit 1 [Trebouxia sp. C0010 RCD-2024]